MLARARPIPLLIGAHQGAQQRRGMESGCFSRPKARVCPANILQTAFATSSCPRWAEMRTMFVSSKLSGTPEP